MIAWKKETNLIEKIERQTNPIEIIADKRHPNRERVRKIGEMKKEKDKSIDKDWGKKSTKKDNFQ